jgi:molecular chaperone DnaK
MFIHSKLIKGIHMTSQKTIGIDLGTTGTVVSVVENGKATVIKNKGASVTPSWIAVDKDGNWIVGEAAARQAVKNPKGTFYEVKRLIGRKFDDPNVAKMQEKVAYDIVPLPNGDAGIKLPNGDVVPPAFISGKLLAEMKKVAETYLNEEVVNAVVTVPAYFNDSQRQATKDAGRIAGLNVERLVPEPTAAALAYGMKKETDGFMLVYDLGGGTFDVSILKVETSKDVGAFNSIEVVSINGNTFLGGANFDAVIMKYVMDQIEASTGYAIPSGDRVALQRVKQACEEAKIALSDSVSAEITLPFLGMVDGAPINAEVELTRAKLEELVAPLIESSIPPIESALADAKLSPADRQKLEVILVGSQTRMPAIKDRVEKFFGKPVMQAGFESKEIVAEGAAYQGAVLTGEVQNTLLIDVTPLDIGIKTKGDVMTVLVPRNTSIPCEIKQVFSTATDNQADIQVEIYQGPRTQASANKLLGNFVLDGIPPAPTGVPEIEITIALDANGLMKVTAMELATKISMDVTIEAGSGMTEAEIQAMIKEAEANKAQDEAFKKLAEAQNTAESLLTTVKKDMEQEWFQSSDASLKSAFNDNLETLKAAVANKDATLILSTVEAINKQKTEIGKAFFEKAKKNNAGGDNTAAATATAAPQTPDNKGGKPTIAL